MDSPSRYEIIRLQDIFKTPTVARALNLLLADPGLCYMQGDLKRRLNVDKATMRVALTRLQRLGLLEVDVNPVGVHLNAIMFNDETEQGQAVLAFYRRIAALQLENKDQQVMAHGYFAHSRYPLMMCIP